MNIENELKFIPKENITRKQVIEILRKLGISVLEGGKIVHQEDTYFDDKAGTLEKSGGSFRIRRKSDKIQVTYKIPVDSNTEYKQRKEYEITVSKEHIRNISMELAMGLLQQEYPELTFPENMTKILTVINDRNKTNLTCQDGTILEMAFDTLRGKDEYGETYDIHPEIEFETISGNPNNLANIYEAIANELNGEVQINTLSKYARTKREINEKKKLGETTACAIFVEILNSTEFNKLSQKGQILHRYDKPTLTNLDNFRDFDYLVKTIESIKNGEYVYSIPREIAEKPEIAELLRSVNYQVKDSISLEEMTCLLLSDVKYKVADEVLADFLNKNYYGLDHAITNRLSHSQQVMLASGLVAKSSEVGASLEERLTCMMTALSHDIGHVPMSHTLERTLYKIDGLFSHEINGKKTIERICEESKERIITNIKKFFPNISEQEIQDIKESKMFEIQDGISNHSRKGSDHRTEGINNQAARAADKICYSASDVCDLIKHAQTILGEQLTVIGEEWASQAVLEICDKNQDLAKTVREALEENIIMPFREGNYGRVVVNAINSIERNEQGDTVYYDVNPKMWKFIEKLIERVKDVRENMGIEQAKTEMSKVAVRFIIEELYKECVANNGNTDVAWDNLLSNITRMGELDILEYLRTTSQTILIDELKNKESITNEDKSKIIAAISERAYGISMIQGKTTEEASKSVEEIRKALQQLPPKQVLEYFERYQALKDIPIEPIIDQLHGRADVQLKIKPDANVSIHGICRDLKIDSNGGSAFKTILDQYYRVNIKGLSGTIARVRQVNEELLKTVTVKVPIEKNVSERVRKQYTVSCSADLTIDEMMQVLMRENPGLEVSLQAPNPYETLNISRTEFTRYYGPERVIFVEDTFKGKNGEIMQEIEIRCPDNPQIVAKIKGKLRKKYEKNFVKKLKIERVRRKW